MTEERTQRRLAGDVVSTGRLMEADEAGMLATVNTRRCNVLNPLVAKYQGCICNARGPCGRQR